MTKELVCIENPSHKTNCFWARRKIHLCENCDKKYYPESHGLRKYTKEEQEKYVNMTKEEQYQLLKEFWDGAQKYAQEQLHPTIFQRIKRIPKWVFPEAYSN